MEVPGEGGGGVGLPLAERAAGGGMHLQGAGQPLPVPRRYARLGGGVDGAKFGPEGGFAQPTEALAGRFPDFRWHGRQWGQPLGQGAEIEACASHHDGRLAPRGDALQHGFGRRQPAADRPSLGGVRDAEQMMRDPGLFLGRGSRREHPQVAIDLQRIGIDDLAAQALG